MHSSIAYRLVHKIKLTAESVTITSFVCEHKERSVREAISICPSVVLVFGISQ